MLFRKVTMSGVVSPVFTWSSEVVTPSVPIDADRWPAHAPDLARHLDRRRLAVGAGHRDHGLRVRDIKSRGELGEQAARLGIGKKRHSIGFRLRSSDHGDRSAIDRLPNEVLAIEQGALERAEHAAVHDLAMIDGKAGHFGIGVDVREVAQFHPGQPFGCVS